MEMCKSWSMGNTPARSQLELECLSDPFVEPISCSLYLLDLFNESSVPYHFYADYSQKFFERTIGEKSSRFDKG